MEVAVWTTVFLGGDLLILIFLVLWAIRKDREKLSRTSGEGQDAT